VVGRGFSPEIGDEGAVSGRITDGYLTASGNFDADMNGMSGGEPYYQQVGGTFFLDSVQTRFPCSLTVSFWRNTFTSSDPPASAALTDNRVRITCLAGQFAIQGGTLLLNPGEYYEFVDGIPLSSTGDPRSATGTYGGFATCDNTQVSIQARIEWNVQPRVHILLGIVRECYEVGTPCATACNGDPPPDTIYLTISNFSGTLPDSPFVVNATYVLTRDANFCDSWSASWPPDCVGFSSGSAERIVVSKGIGIDMSHHTPINGGLCANLYMNSTTAVPVICGTGVVGTGSGNAFYEGVSAGTFDWEIEV
jgi:hypothetical protein